MSYSENAAAAAGTLSGGCPSFQSPTSSSLSPSSTLPPVILSPCAACKILRRRCIEKCVLAPYFPPTEPLKFTIAHRVFGASNIIKLLQELPECQRADAVNSMVYEANARIRDPVYGCAGSICQLQNQISELQAELAKAQAEILNMQCQNANLFELICKRLAAQQHDHDQDQDQENNDNYLTQPMPYHENSTFLIDESLLGVSWETLNLDVMEQKFF